MLWRRQARSRREEEPEPYVPNLRRPEYRWDSRYVAPFYSKSRSFLNFLPVNRDLPCSEDAALNVQYIVQGDELKQGQEVLDCFYLVRLC